MDKALAANEGAGCIKISNEGRGQEMFFWFFYALNGFYYCCPEGGEGAASAMNDLA